METHESNACLLSFEIYVPKEYGGTFLNEFFDRFHYPQKVGVTNSVDDWRIDLIVMQREKDLFIIFLKSFYEQHGIKYDLPKDV